MTFTASNGASSDCEMSAELIGGGVTTESCCFDAEPIFRGNVYKISLRLIRVAKFKCTLFERVCIMFLKSTSAISTVRIFSILIRMCR